MRARLGRVLQIAGLVGVGVVLILNLYPEGITMATMLQLTLFGVLLFAIGTVLAGSRD